MKQLTVIAVILMTLLLMTSAKPPVSDSSKKIQAIKEHKQAIHIKEDGWIRDPYIVLGPDDKYYLTGTTPMPGDPREKSDPYNTGLGVPYSQDDASQYSKESNYHQI